MMLPDYWLQRPAMEIAAQTRTDIDQLLGRAISAATITRIDYHFPIPRWQFLCHLADEHGIILHGTGDLGRAKTDSARDRLRGLNPHVEIVLQAARGIGHRGRHPSEFLGGGPDLGLVGQDFGQRSLQAGLDRIRTGHERQAGEHFVNSNITLAGFCPSYLWLAWSSGCARYFPWQGKWALWSVFRSLFSLCWCSTAKKSAALG